VNIVLKILHIQVNKFVASHWQKHPEAIPKTNYLISVFLLNVIISLKYIICTSQQHIAEQPISARRNIAEKERTVAEVCYFSENVLF